MQTITRPHVLRAMTLATAVALPLGLFTAATASAGTAAYFGRCDGVYVSGTTIGMDKATLNRYTYTSDYKVFIRNVSTNQNFSGLTSSAGWTASGIGKAGNTVSVTMTNSTNTQTICGGGNPYVLK